jgi:hypothetical protein
MISPGLLSRRVPDRCSPAGLQLSDQTPIEKAGTLAALLGFIELQLLCQLDKCLKKGGKFVEQWRFCLEIEHRTGLVTIF